MCTLIAPEHKEHKINSVVVMEQLTCGMRKCIERNNSELRRDNGGERGRERERERGREGG